MFTIKKLTALVLALTLVFALTACADSGGKNSIFDDQGMLSGQRTDPTQAGNKPMDSTPATGANAPETTAPVITYAPADGDSFAAIGNPGINASAVGTWAYTLDYGELMGSVSEEDLAQLGDMADAMMAIYEDVTMEVILDLRADGSFSFGIDEDSARAAVEEMIPKLGEVMLPLMASMMGVTEEELEKQLTDAGMTMDDMMGQIMTQFNPDEMVAQITESTRNGSWRYVDGKLYIVEDGSTLDPERYTTVTLSGNSLTITSVPSDPDDEMYQKLLPMVFTRK